MESMDTNKMLLGKILGEIYRLQKKIGVPHSASDPHIYGLLNGFESVIDEQIEKIGWVSKEQFNHTISVLTPYWKDENKLADFKGFYDIESELEDGGVSRGVAIQILSYLYANNQFTDVINKMNSSDSPSECRTFKMNEWDC